VAPTFILYTIATSRGADVLRGLLGPTFAEILGSDGLPIYLTYAASLRQSCWSHFRRNLLSAQDLATTASAKRFCREALALQRQLFRLWHRFRGGPARGAPLTRAELIANVRPIEKKFFALAERFVKCRRRGCVESRPRAVRASRPLLHVRARGGRGTRLGDTIAPAAKRRHRSPNVVQ